MRLKEDFTYVISKTLLGNKLLVGLTESNSYIEIKKEYFNSFFNLMSIINNPNLEITNKSNLESKEKELLSLFSKKGFIGESENIEPSFNEVKSIMTKLYKKNVHNFSFTQSYKKTNFYMIYTMLFIYFTYYILNNITNLNLKLSINDFSVFQLILGLCLFPIIIIIHEFGHFITAQIVGVKVKSITIGWMITHPIVYLDYNGLNLNTTSKKLIVISGGIFAHLLCASLGILLSKHIGFNPIINLWILSNLSMIVTNLLIFGPSDGYFFLTNLIGVYNLRYRGYKSIKAFFTKKLKYLSKLDKISGVILSLLLILSLEGMFKSLLYLCTILSIPLQLSNIVAIVTILLFVVRLILKIKNLKINY